MPEITVSFFAGDLNLHFWNKLLIYLVSMQDELPVIAIWFRKNYLLSIMTKDKNGINGEEISLKNN